MGMSLFKDVSTMISPRSKIPWSFSWNLWGLERLRSWRVTWVFGSVNVKQRYVTSNTPKSGDRSGSPQAFVPKSGEFFKDSNPQSSQLAAFFQGCRFNTSCFKNPQVMHQRRELEELEEEIDQSFNTQKEYLGETKTYTQLASRIASQNSTIVHCSQFGSSPSPSGPGERTHSGGEQHKGNGMGTDMTFSSFQNLCVFFLAFGNLLNRSPCLTVWIVSQMMGTENLLGSCCRLKAVAGKHFRDHLVLLDITDI